MIIKPDIGIVYLTEHEFNVTLKHVDYLPCIDDGREMEIQAYAFVKAKRSRPPQNCIKSHTVEFGAPTLEVEVGSFQDLVLRSAVSLVIICYITKNY